MRGWQREQGSGSILVVAIIGALLSLATLATPLYAVLVVKQRVGGAADAAALAAADVAIGRAPGIPCDVARRVAEANGAGLGACEPDGLLVTVGVETSVLGFVVAASATAGPPSAAP